jgi:hypothetical protein
VNLFGLQQEVCVPVRSKETNIYVSENEIKRSTIDSTNEQVPQNRIYDILQVDMRLSFRRA